jgi:hypothetical protein
MASYTYTIGKKLDLVQEQRKTLKSPRRKSNVFLKLMYITFDLFYGRKGSLPKVKVLELLARYPYTAWEGGGYRGITKYYAKKKPVDSKHTEKYLYIINEGREANDNETLHLLLLDDIIRQKGIRLGCIRFTLIPHILAFGYYFFTRFLFMLKPAWSFSMNASFESHAEHEYMQLAKEHPQWDKEKVTSVYFKYYPRQKSLGDLLRRIALDERDHLYRSLELIEKYTY